MIFISFINQQLSAAGTNQADDWKWLLENALLQLIILSVVAFQESKHE